MSESIKALGIMLLLVIVIVLLRPMCAREPPTPDQRIADVADQALSMARNANDDAAAYKASCDRWYFVAVVAAGAMPLAIALLLFRYYTRTPPEDLEVLEQVKRLEREVQAEEQAGQQDRRIQGDERPRIQGDSGDSPRQLPENPAQLGGLLLGSPATSSTSPLQSPRLRGAFLFNRAERGLAGGPQAWGN